MSLLDPSYASQFMPLVASVSEHSPSTWGSYFGSFHQLMLYVPGGFYLVLSYKKKMTYGKLFIALYALTSCYFSSVMTRL